MTQQELHDRIIALTKEYCDTYHRKSTEFHEGDRIPYASRVYDHEEMCNLVDSALEFWLTAGRYAAAFEKDFAAYLGVKYVSLVSSGSSANLAAFMALTSPLLGERRVRRGDEVITVAAGFPTTVAPMVQYGAVPVFVDVTIPQYNIDVSMLEEARSERTKAVMIAHTLGNPFDLTAVRDFCRRHDLWLVEDNCDALGSTYTIAVYGDDRRHRHVEFLSAASHDDGRGRRGLYEQSEAAQDRALFPRLGARLRMSAGARRFLRAAVRGAARRSAVRVRS